MVKTFVQDAETLVRINNSSVIGVKVKRNRIYPFDKKARGLSTCWNCGPTFYKVYKGSGLCTKCTRESNAKIKR